MAARVLRKFCSPTTLSPLKHYFSLCPRNTSLFVTRNVCIRMASTSTSKAKEKKDVVTVSFIDRDGDKMTVSAKIGDSLLDVAKDNDLDLEGACEGTLSCSTCHLIFEPEEMKTLNLDDPSDEELDMLDLAYGLEDTSRLGCQIIVTKAFEGITLRVPKAHRDVRDF
ncbi:unnamed protein product [Pocillopora meandrina]|uniref:2Fe-2S ferredoxin-type domain-containing protein n=1 Tax=Pocillopora meandrina TaxID=46732 RepID=A0AAU9VTH5_9CNID|nr:unnamed protein product [Pocillopora meandrina]